MAGIVGVNVVMAFVAGGDANGAVVEPDYYRKAVQWDSTMALRAASARLGWTADVALHEGPRGDTGVDVRLTDGAGAAVTGATVSATLIHNADAARHLDVMLRDLGGGRYAVEAALDHPGQWEVRIDAVRGGAHFVDSQRAELRPGTAR